MTDERQGQGLWQAVAALPKGSGVIFRHYSLPPRERQSLFARLQAVARRKRLLLVAAGPQPLPADGIHGLYRRKRANRIVTASAHDLREIRAAEAAGAMLVFLSPVFRTRSHPGAKPLGRVRFAALARQTRLPVIALGGMDQRRARTLAGAYGWAAIDAWSYQKRKAVPT